MNPSDGRIKMGLGEFASLLADLTMDLEPIGEIFGRWHVEKYREWELCCDALVLQWYAGQNFLAEKAAADRFSDILIRDLIRSYNRRLEEYVIPGGIDPEMKTQVLLRIKRHRSHYDKLMTAGKNRGILSGDLLLDIGATFAFISGNMGSFKVRKLGTELYKATLERCAERLGGTVLEDIGQIPESEERE